MHDVNIFEFLTDMILWNTSQSSEWIKMTFLGVRLTHYPLRDVAIILEL